MEQQQNSRKKLLLAALALIVLIAAFALVYQAFKPKAMAGGKHITISVVYEDLSSKDFEYTTDAQYLGDAMKENELITGTDGPYGLYILAVDQVSVDESKQQWWKLTENGELTNYSADLLPIKDGGHYELTFTTGWD